jgi:Etoposide-induced protein 2.4 (EI24)
MMSEPVNTVSPADLRPSSVRHLGDAFWRAAAYCLHPRVIALSILPLVIVGGLAGALGYFFWEAAIAGVRSTMESWLLVATFLQWLDSIGAAAFRSVLGPLIVVALAVPVIVVVSLLLVAVLMTPAIVDLVAKRRFPTLERKRGGSFAQGVLWSLGCTFFALVLLLFSIPLWFVPPLVLLLPPLIWGWLTYRVLTFDVLAEHASTEERQALMREHRWPLLGMGVVAGYLGAAPSLLWAVSATMLIFAPILILVSVWVYTLVFAFSALWFAHFALSALQHLRASRDAAAVVVAPLPAPVPALAHPNLDLPAALPPP